jgi:hypothetical protein
MAWGNACCKPNDVIKTNNKYIISYLYFYNQSCNSLLLINILNFCFNLFRLNRQK